MAKRYASSHIAVKELDRNSIGGHFAGVASARKAMEIDWMTRDELAQAVPPAYSRYIAEQYLLS